MRDDVSLCRKCHCMTHSVRNIRNRLYFCGKCKALKEHPKFGLGDQAAGHCEYCLASAEMDCDCQKIGRYEMQKL